MGLSAWPRLCDWVLVQYSMRGRIGYDSGIQAAGKGGALISRRSVTNSRGVTTTVDKFARPIWTADAWLLERRHPDEFAVNAREIKALTKEMKVLAERAGILESGLPLPPLQQVLASLPPDLRRGVEEELRREAGRR